MFSETLSIFKNQNCFGDVTLVLDVACRWHFISKGIDSGGV